MTLSRHAFSPARNYLPTPDNDPAPIPPGDFVWPTEAEIKAARLEVERYKRRLLDAPHGAPRR